MTDRVVADAVSTRTHVVARPVPRLHLAMLRHPAQAQLAELSRATKSKAVNIGLQRHQELALANRRFDAIDTAAIG